MSPKPDHIARVLPNLRRITRSVVEGASVSFNPNRPTDCNRGIEKNDNSLRVLIQQAKILTNRRFSIAFFLGFISFCVYFLVE